MATIGTNALTLADWAKRTDPDGSIPDIVEILNQTNEILDDMLWLPSNQPTSHVTTIRSGLPSVAWRMLNYGVQPSKSRTVQVTDGLGMLEAYSEIDKKLCDLNGGTAEFRLSEEKSFIEAMSQQQATTLFYGNTDTDPKTFTGLTARYSTMVTANAESSDNVINGGGTANTNTSIWLVGWSDNTVHGLFPKGMKAGLQVEDLGQHTLLDANNGKYEGYRTHYQWDCGLTVRDWRYCVRICNIDVTTLTKNAATGADIIDLMTQSLERIKSINNVTPVFYVGRTVRAWLRRQLVNKVQQSTLTMDTVSGKKVLMFDVVPVRRVDALLQTEATVV